MNMLFAKPNNPILLRCKETMQVLLLNSTPPCETAGREGRSHDDHLRKIGYRSDLRLDNKLLMFYGRHGDTERARHLFDEMPRRTTISWTSMISIYSRNGFPEEAIRVFVNMRREEGLCCCYPNQFTFGSVLKACSTMGCLFIGNQVHGIALQSGFFEDVFVQASLVDLHAKCGSIDDARFIFDHMVVERDLVSWNAMIGGYAAATATAAGADHKSFELFRRMLKEGIAFDDFTVSSLLKVCGRSGSTSGEIEQIHTVVIQLGFGNNNIVAGSLIDAYAKCKNMNNARNTYQHMKDKDLISFTALITGYSQATKACSSDALDIFHRNEIVDFQMDRIVLCSMLNICADTASANLGRQLHACAVKNQCKTDSAMSNSLVDMYAKIGEIEDARRVFDEMQVKNVISWTSMINGYGKHGYGEDAITLFKEMENQGLKPNDVTFLSLLFACSHSGLTDKGWNLFSTMVSKYNIHPKDKHYSCLVDLLARGGRLEEAYNLLLGVDMKLNSSLWRTLLGACNLHEDLFFGKIAADWLLQMDPHWSANYVILANIYASSAHWEDAQRTRRLMEEKQIRKCAAWSSIQLSSRKKPLLLNERC